MVLLVVSLCWCGFAGFVLTVALVLRCFRLCVCGLGEWFGLLLVCGCNWWIFRGLGV